MIRIKRHFHTLVALLLIGLSHPLQAGNDRLLMMRSTQSFPEAMLALQKTIGEYGYTISRVQRVDIGLTSSGFATDKYRIVFFGKPEEVRHLSEKYPQLIPYLPLKITLFAEQEETLLTTFDPEILTAIASDELFRAQAMRWRSDIIAIFDELRE
ncbi:MAG TPA: DUF302 domain-containing protein [Ectothiorhodospiraceae bacterium]|nr:DUF302 domain-containing protein [Ectothiorhodospiraceae bacterium]